MAVRHICVTIIISLILESSYAAQITNPDDTIAVHPATIQIDPAYIVARTPTRSPSFGRVICTVPSCLIPIGPISFYTPPPTPATSSPITAQPTFANPTTATPTTAAPTTSRPTTSAPTSAAPTSAQPTTSTPTTGTPTTGAPTLPECDCIGVISNGLTIDGNYHLSDDTTYGTSFRRPKNNIHLYYDTNLGKWMVVGNGVYYEAVANSNDVLMTTTTMNLNFIDKVTNNVVQIEFNCLTGDQCDITDTYGPTTAESTTGEPTTGEPTIRPTDVSESTSTGDDATPAPTDDGVAGPNASPVASSDPNAGAGGLTQGEDKNQSALASLFGTDDNETATLYLAILAVGVCLLFTCIVFCLYKRKNDRQLKRVQQDMNTMKAKQTADKINALRATNASPDTLSPHKHGHEAVSSVSNVSLSPGPLHMAASSSIGSVSSMQMAPRPALPSCDTDTNLSGENNVFMKNQTIPPGTVVNNGIDGIDTNMMAVLPPRVASVQPVGNLMAATPMGPEIDTGVLPPEDDEETPPPLPPPAPQEIDDMDNDDLNVNVMIDHQITRDNEDMYAMDLNESDDGIEGTHGNLVPNRPTPGESVWED